MKDANSIPNEYDEDYYERGISSGKSGYQDYRWMPERTIRFVHKIMRELNIREGDLVLDYGCAKGFLVKAFRILDVNAYGCDISKYAIDNAEKEVASYCSLMRDGKVPYDFNFDWVISKDVFEHLSKNQLEKTLSDLGEKSSCLFAIVPLGDGKKYVIPQYEADTTHVIRESRGWWESEFERNGWNIDRFSYLINGMKDNWAQYKKGNGFFFLKNGIIRNKNGN